MIIYIPPARAGVYINENIYQEAIYIGGELVLQVEKVKSDGNFTRPNESFYDINRRYGNDLNIFEKDSLLHICGNNDWAYLAVDLLKPLLREANKLYYEISKRISDVRPEVVVVGKNDFRMLDILHLVRDTEEGVSIIKNVPIVKGNFLNGVKFFGKKDIEELPFE